MIVPLDLAVTAGTLVVAFVVSRLTDSETKRRSLPPTVRTAVEAVALGGVWLAYFGGAVPAVVVNAAVVALALSLAILVVAPVAIAPFVETTPAPEATC